jgi:hypothetical protein
MKKILRLTLLIASFFGLAGQTIAATLYGATAAGAPGTLYTLDPATGAVIQTIGALNDAGGANYSMTGLAVHPITGVLYGSTGNANTAAQGTLVIINPLTALVTVIGPFNAGPTNTSGSPATMADIDFDAAGNLYGVASIGGPNLYSINSVTAQATLVGANGASTSTSGGGLAISAAGVYYGTPTSSRYGTYDSSTGVYTNITNPTKPAGTGAYGALSFNPDTGVLYGLNVGPGSPPPTALVTIDPATGAVTLVGNSAASIDAIAFGPTIPEPAAAIMLAPLALLLRRRRSTSRWSPSDGPSLLPRALPKVVVQSAQPLVESESLHLSVRGAQAPTLATDAI